MISFVVPGQPKGKGRPRIGKVGQHARMFTPTKTVNYESLIAYSAQQAMHQRALFDGPVSVVMRIDCAIPASWSDKKRLAALAGEVYPTTKPDADNVVKAVFDGLNGVAWRDDVQVVDLVVFKRYSGTPCVRVQIKAVAQ